MSHVFVAATTIGLTKSFYRSEILLLVAVIAMRLVHILWLTTRCAMMSFKGIP